MENCNHTLDTHKYRDMKQKGIHKQQLKGVRHREITHDERIKVIITLWEAEWSWTKIGNYLNIDRQTCQKVNKDTYYSSLKGYFSSLKGMKELKRYRRANK